MLEIKAPWDQRVIEKIKFQKPNQIEEILDRIYQIEFQQRLMIEKLTQLVEKFGKHINNVEKLMKKDAMMSATGEQKKQ